MVLVKVFISPAAKSAWKEHRVECAEGITIKDDGLAYQPLAGGVFVVDQREAFRAELCQIFRGPVFQIKQSPNSLPGGRNPVDRPNNSSRVRVRR